MALPQGRSGPRPRPWIVTAAGRTLSGARAGLAAGLVTAVPFGVLAAVVVALGHASGGEALLLVLAVFFTVASLATVVNSRTLLLRLELRAMRMEGLSVPGVAALGGGYPLPLGIGFPMDPPALAELARIVSERQPETIVELGSGISSLVMGLTLRRLGRGHVTTYDHDLDWADETRRRVAALGLSDLVTVVHAPLVEVEVEGTRRPWYGLADALPGKPIDLLVVDGPPGTTGGDGLARWPAFPMLASHLSDGAVVFVDDVSRKDESTMVRRWLAGTSGWKSRRVLTEHGVAVLERVPSK